MHADLIRNKRRRVGAALATVAVLALTPGAALAAPPKPKPRPKPVTPYMTYTLSEVQISGR
jgi:hypothetical protein